MLISKTKMTLVNARKAVEREMERFKDCEKETKTKAFLQGGPGTRCQTGSQGQTPCRDARLDQRHCRAAARIGTGPPGQTRHLKSDIALTLQQCHHTCAPTLYLCMIA